MSINWNKIISVLAKNTPDCIILWFAILLSCFFLDVTASATTWTSNSFSIASKAVFRTQTCASTPNNTKDVIPFFFNSSNFVENSLQPKQLKCIFSILVVSSGILRKLIVLPKPFGYCSVTISGIFNISDALIRIFAFWMTSSILLKI